jgi:hypothetical protein
MHQPKEEDPDFSPEDIRLFVTSLAQLEMP